MNKNIWIIGAGDMAIEYAKVLKGIGVEFEVVGRGETSASRFEEMTRIQVQRGGVEQYLKTAGYVPEYAIVPVYPLSLKEVSLSLIHGGVKYILLEKPGAMNLDELQQIKAAADEKQANVYIAYNRRFYESVREAKRLIEKDGGITSFNFEFTEWAHVIEKANKPAKELEDWFIANSTHVVDLAYFFGGDPVDIASYVSGKLSWYSKASAFAGAGKTNKGIVFSYKANWASAGRWSVEVLTKEHKFLFEPMEKLKMQDRGTVKVYDVEINDQLDTEYKPGLYLQTKAFLDGATEDMIDINGQINNQMVYDLMQSNNHACIDEGKWRILK